MLAEERRSLIVKTVNEKKSVTTEALMEEFGVSESTIRRDIIHLSRQGKLLRVYGGAVSMETSGEGIVKSRNPYAHVSESDNDEDKLTIAACAAGLISSGDYVFIDSGTTTEFMINLITERKATYVLTLYCIFRNIDFRKHFLEQMVSAVRQALLLLMSERLLSKELQLRILSRDRDIFWQTMVSSV